MYKVFCQLQFMAVVKRYICIFSRIAPFYLVLPAGEPVTFFDWFISRQVICSLICCFIIKITEIYILSYRNLLAVNVDVVCIKDDPDGFRHVVNINNGRIIGSNWHLGEMYNLISGNIYWSGFRYYTETIQIWIFTSGIARSRNIVGNWPVF